MLSVSDKRKKLVAAAIFGLCIGPTFISYQSYTYRWDDSDYLQRAIGASRAFWSADLYGLKHAMVSIRPPAMTLLGLPWGPLQSWDAAGKCFITLATAISFLAATCLYLLLRIGVSPLLLVAASVCTFASSILPFPPHPLVGVFAERGSLQSAATAFLADNLFAWACLAAVLLIPLEVRISFSSVRGAVLRGLLWALVLSLGTMIKLSFLYFVLLIVPLLFLVRLHHAGLRNALSALITFACCSVPAAFYLIRWGQPAFEYARQASYVGLAGFYYIPLLPFLGEIIRDSPGVVLSFVLSIAALLHLVVRRRTIVRGADLAALLIVIGFGVVAFASPNREIRLAFPAIVGLPFLTSILMSVRGYEVPRRFATLIAGLVFCGLVAASVPMKNRADNQSLRRSDAVLSQAAACHARRIALATDSPSLNANLMDLAVAISGPGASATALEVSTLAYGAPLGAPIEKDFQQINETDQVVFQDRPALNPPFTNQRVAEYEQYVRQRGYVPIRVGDDLTVYSVRCSTSNR